MSDMDFHRSRADRDGGEAEKLSWALHELAAAWAASDTIIAKRLGLTPTDYLALKHVMVEDVPIGPAELSRRLGMSTGSVNALIDRLEDRGYVVREPHASDRRRLVLSVSSGCRDKITEALRPLGERVDEITGSMTREEIATVRRFLKDTARSYKEHSRRERKE